MFNKLDSSVLYECGISNRINARSVSWNSTGTYLALGCSDRTTRVYALNDLLSNSSSSSSSSSSSVVREFVTIPSTVDRVRFHSTQEYLLATTGGTDSMVKLWDVRTGNHRSMGQIELKKNSGAIIDIAWSGESAGKENFLAITERNSAVRIVDTRKLSSSKTNPSNQNALPFVKTFDLRPKIVDACIFSPSGDHLIAATSEDGYGELTVWNWKEANKEEGINKQAEQKQENKEKSSHENNDPNNSYNKTKFVYPAHTGPIYSLCFSRDGQRLATGGGDALVGLWDVNSMVCTSTITRCNRFVRSVSFTFDSHIIATSTEDNSIDIATSNRGEFVGKVSLAEGRSNNRGGGNERNSPGADEITFHPRAHLLACARCDSAIHSPLTVVKLNLSR